MHVQALSSHADGVLGGFFILAHECTVLAVAKDGMRLLSLSEEMADGDGGERIL